MKWWKKGLLWILCCLVMLGCSPAALAAYDPTARILSRLQGQWVDGAGRTVLDFAGNTVNGCPVVGVYHAAGGSSDFSCSIRIVEAAGCRDLPIIGESLRDDSYHAHVILNGDNRDESRGELLMRIREPRYAESVGGIGIDMTEEDVRARYGSPDTIQPKMISNGKEWKGQTIWSYKKLGMDLTMRHQRVLAIRICRDGDRHFDRTGLSCASLPAEFQAAYGFRHAPQAGQFAAYGVGHGEYLWFDDYPRSITLSPYWN